MCFCFFLLFINFKFGILEPLLFVNYMIFWHWQPTNGSLDGYEHIVNVEYCPPVLSESPHFPSEAAEAKEAAQNDPSTQNTVEYHELMEGTLPNSIKTDRRASVRAMTIVCYRWNDTWITTSRMDESWCQLSLGNVAILRTLQYPGKSNFKLLVHHAPTITVIVITR